VNIEVGTITLIAVAMAPGMADSAPTIGVYQIFTPPPSCSPTPSPPPGNYQHDFLLSFEPSSFCQGSICYTLDGSAPTCAHGLCGPTSKTYDPTKEISIDASVVDPVTHRVVVNALLCGANCVAVAPPMTYVVVQP
jgi:hypothetical protein